MLQVLKCSMAELNWLKGCRDEMPALFLLETWQCFAMLICK